MVKPYIPSRADIIWIDFDPQIGHEQSGRRPAVVISPQSYNRNASLMLACPVTTKIKGYPFEVRIKTNKTDGVILADQVKSLDWSAREMKFIEKAPAEVVEQVQDFVEMLVRE
jgi:mRNA interferase MazF